MPIGFDHLVIAANTLEQGIQYVHETLGVKMPIGGVHPTMGTHNCLMRLGGNANGDATDDPYADVFLEIIAINPNGCAPNRPRWYALDDPFVQARIDKQPMLLTWVINTTDLQKLLSLAAVPAGQPALVTRDDLRWYFALPEDGRLLGAGALPYLIQWLTPKHPSADMQNKGCQLQGFEIYHPHSDWLITALQALGAADHVVVHQASNNKIELIATIKSPNGLVQLTNT